MSIDPSAVPPRRRRSPWRIFFPSILLLIVFVAWSGFWWFAAGKAEDSWNDIVERQAARGVTITCGERAIEGFPFRFEVRCTRPDITVAREDGPRRITAGAVRLVGQIYQPNKFIAEADGPLVVEVPATATRLEARWKSATASLSVWTDGPKDARLVVEGLDMTVTRDGTPEPLVQGGALKAFARNVEVPGAAPGSFDLNASLQAAGLPPVDRVLGGTPGATLTFDGLVTQLNNWEPRPTPRMLRDWAEAGGVLKIERLRLDRGPSSVIVAGELSADVQGRLNGKDMALTLAGVPELADTLKRSGLAPANLASFLGVGLSIAGRPSNIDGRSAVEVPVTLREGKVGVASLPLATLPPLFAAQ